MSTPTIHAFLDKAHHDPVLQEKLSRIPQTLDAASAQQLSDLAREAGFDLSVSDFIAAVSLNEIRDEELAAVAGGVDTNSKATPIVDDRSWWKKIFDSSEARERYFKRKEAEQTGTNTSHP